MLAALMVVFALWATATIAGVNEDFFEAARNGDLPAVKRFIDKGTNVNARANDGATALLAASLNGHQEVVQALLDKGADVNAKDNYGATALILASQRGHQEVKELLIGAGAK